MSSVFVVVVVWVRHLQYLQDLSHTASLSLPWEKWLLNVLSGVPALIFRESWKPKELNVVGEMMQIMENQNVEVIRKSRSSMDVHA